MPASNQALRTRGRSADIKDDSLPALPMISLKSHDVHLWIAQPLSIQDPELLSDYQHLLTTEEQTRQQRFKFARHRHDALVTRALVRTVLSHYAHRKPADWRFEKNAYGKPEIVDPPVKLRFNLSHTENFIVCAVTADHAIGVDAEWLERQSDTLSIADRFFSPLEVADLFRLPANEQENRFFDYWTLKESYIKACGLGLAIPLDHFSFAIGHSDNPVINTNIRLHFASERNDNPDNWQSWLFYPNESHRLALSIRCTPQDTFNLRFFHTTPLSDHQEIQLPMDL